MNKNCPEIIELKLRIESYIDRKVQTPTDFDFLCGMIWERIHENISSSTLKRIWGYVDGVDSTRLSTLNILAKFLDYKDWDGFVSSLEDDDTSNSECILAPHISSEDLEIGECLKIAWQPNRECHIEYIGDKKFEVIFAKNSKLKAGDTFRCSLFIMGEPVYIDDLVRVNEPGPPVLFVIGNKSGLTILERINKN